MDSTWSGEALQQLPRCHLVSVHSEPAAGVVAELWPELVVAVEVLERGSAVEAELLVEVERVQARVVQLSALRQASLPALPALPPDRRQALRQPC